MSNLRKAMLESNKFIPLNGKIEKSFEFKWQMLLFTTVRRIVITWMNTAWLIKVMQLAGSFQTKAQVMWIVL